MGKTLFILVGKKGSGKTFVGELMAEEFGIEFFRVEDVWLKVKEEKLSKEYIKQGFTMVENGIHEKLRKTDKLVIESTASHREFLRHLSRLKIRYDAVLIKVEAPAKLCRERIRRRNHDLHVDFSEDMIEQINSICLVNENEFSLIIDNEDIGGEHIILPLRTFLENYLK